jgi:hypothetical protein
MLSQICVHTYVPARGNRAPLLKTAGCTLLLPEIPPLKPCMVYARLFSSCWRTQLHVHNATRDCLQPEAVACAVHDVLHS